MPAPLVARPSGLIAPTVIDRTIRRPRAMARKKFLRLWKQMDFARACGLKITYRCAACGTPARLQHEDDTLVQAVRDERTINPNTDNFTISCQCSVWTVKA